MNSYESTSLFATALGTGIGWAFGGPIGGAVLGSLFGGIGGAFASDREQRKQQAKLQAAQLEQSKRLREALQADTAELYSSVKSSINQTSGAMGAIY